MRNQVFLLIVLFIKICTNMAYGASNTEKVYDGQINNYLCEGLPLSFWYAEVLSRIVYDAPLIIDDIAQKAENEISKLPDVPFLIETIRNRIKAAANVTIKDSPIWQTIKNIRLTCKAWSIFPSDMAFKPISLTASNIDISLAYSKLLRFGTVMRFKPFTDFIYSSGNININDPLEIFCRKNQADSILLPYIKNICNHAINLCDKPAITQKIIDTLKPLPTSFTKSYIEDIVQNHISGHLTTRAVLYKKTPNACAKKYPTSLLNLCARLGATNTLSMLLGKCMKTKEERDAVCLPLLLNACKRIDLRTIDLLVNSGVDVNVQDEEGNSPLLIICKENPSNVSLIEFMLHSGANIELKNINNESPLSIIASRKKNSHIMNIHKMFLLPYYRQITQATAFEIEH